ncbi:MAG: 7TM diverse intracellular signaling domain-containing protein [Winogradskyella sp.]
MKLPHIIKILLFTSGLLINSLTAQNLSLYTVDLDDEFSGESLPTQNFEFVENNVANYDNGKWIAVKLEIPVEMATNDNYIYLAYSLIDYVELWTYDISGSFNRIHRTGQSFNFNTRPYPSSDFIFPILDGVKTYYFKIYSSKPIVLPFEIHSSQSLFQTLTHKDLLIGVFIGIILVMFLYNLVIQIFTRDKVYSYYVVYLFTLLFTQTALFGYTDRFLFQEFPNFNQKFATLSGALVAITSVFFVSKFLNLRTKSLLLYRLFFLVVILDLFGVFLILMNWSVVAFHWVNFVSLYGSIIGLIAGIKLSIVGYKPAKFFLTAWSIFLCSVIIFALINLGVIPYNKYLHGSMLIGSSIEAILLSVALADRINILRQEKEASQAQALRMAQENEIIIQEQNIILEEQVKLRTQELQETNMELKVTLDNLNTTHTKLAQSEKMASLGVLTAGIAHEINNPLNYIHGGYTAINEELKTSNKDIKKDDIREYLQWIKSGTDRANKIVKSLNIYSRSNDDNTEDCDLNSIIEDCIAILDHKTKGRIKIKQRLDENLGVVEGHNRKIHQVILNLLVNAIDSIEDEGLINISSIMKDNQVMINIEDNGHGISKEDLDRILDPFFTTKSPGKGTGLGLSISQSIIQDHKGKIQFKSEVNVGTKVTLVLPQKIVSSDNLSA